MVIRSRREIALLVTALAIIAAALIGTGAAETQGATGKRCTIKGTKAKDRLFGTKGPDVICGFAGNDVIWGLKGNDVIRGGRGDDVIRAGKGNDHLYGQPDDDTLYAGLGNDYLDGGPGENSFFTGPGNNKCIDRETDTVTPGCDDTAPAVASLSVDPGQIDTHTAPATVTVTLRMTDDITGIRRDPVIEIQHKKTGQRRWIYPDLESGDAMNGTWTGSITLPKNSPQGRWEFWVTATDRQDNHGMTGPRELEDAGLASGFDQVGVGDETGPTLSNLTVDRATFDTSASSQTLNFRVRVTDDVSGVGSDWFPGPVQINLHSEDGGMYRQVRLELVSGDKFDGIYEGSTEFPRYTPKATWKIQPGAIDFAGNVGYLSEADLKRQGSPTRLSQTSTGDSQAPILRSLNVPEVVDFSAGGEALVATFRATDNLSGLDAGGIGFSVQGPDNWGYSGWVTRISGDDLDGIYEATAWVPSDLPDGTYDLQITLSDKADNIEWYKRQDLLDLGFPGTVTTVSAAP
jgi:hypothetical protein